jgi:hypothetical protein
MRQGMGEKKSDGKGHRKAGKHRYIAGESERLEEGGISRKEGKGKNGR